MATATAAKPAATTPATARDRSTVRTFPPGESPAELVAAAGKLIRRGKAPTAEQMRAVSQFRRAVYADCPANAALIRIYNLFQKLLGEIDRFAEVDLTAEFNAALKAHGVPEISEDHDWDRDEHHWFSAMESVQSDSSGWRWAALSALAALDGVVVNGSTRATTLDRQWGG